MTSALLGGLLFPLLFAGGIGYAVWRARNGKVRRAAPEVAPGRMVIATNLVGSRRRGH
ncbi:MAG TPA: hypothetical protein VF805_15905 [Anaeromyxobacteraceae bacterium]